MQHACSVNSASARNVEGECRLCVKRKDVVRGMKVEEKALLAVCHAVSAGYANMVRRADGLQNAAGVFEGLRTVHDKAEPKQYCSSKHLRTLQGAIKQVEGLDGLSGKCNAQLKRLRNLLGMGAKEVQPKEAAQPKDVQEKDDSSKVKVKRKRDKDTASTDKQEKKSKKQEDLAQSQE